MVSPYYLIALCVAPSCVAPAPHSNDVDLIVIIIIIIVTLIILSMISIMIRIIRI